MPDTTETPHPDHSASLARIRRLEGQIAGIRRMVEEGRYCADILMQTRAAGAALKSIEAEILKRHLEHCVREAMDGSSPADADEKIAEIIQFFKKR